MRLLAWLAIAALVGAPGWVAPAQAACRAPRHHNCFDNLSTLDFSAVPAISQRIVGEERTAEQPKKSVVEAPPITTYTGPTLGVSSMAHAPTVGYYWSLEPDSGK
jgi:hypothetical protein